uniref:RING-type domain-containing protein n=1 Tax=viral metagenome TaxID=1070528 RepID=A0A6C0AQ02_9ZZZZ
MAYPNSIFNISLINDLDRYFPDVLYNSDRFQSVQDLLGYVQGQSRALCPNFEARRALYRQYLDASGAHEPVENTNRPTTPQTPPSPQTPVSEDVSGEEIPITPLRYISMNLLNDVINLGMPPLAPIRPFTTSSRLNNILFSTTSLTNNLIFEQEDYGGLLNSLFGPMEDVIVAPSTEQIRIATTVSKIEKSMDDNCAICQEEVIADAEIRTINRCNHAFHKGCIDQWFERSVFCPICRIDIRSEDID